MDEKVTYLLNQARSAELGAIAQYMIHHYEMEDQDFGKLATKLKETAIAERIEDSRVRPVPMVTLRRRIQEIPKLGQKKKQTLKI